MGKKRHRSPEPEESAFESAKAAFERAGEEDIPVLKTVDLSKPTDEDATPETNTPATPETSVPEMESPETSVPETENPATSEVTVSETESDATPDMKSPTPSEIPVPDTESVTSSETTVSDIDSATPSETTVSDDNNAVTPEADSPAISAATPEPETVDNPDASDAESDIPDSAEPTEPDDEDEDDDEYEPDFPYDTEPEVTEMERHTMETREITLGHHHSPPPETDANTKPFETQNAKEPKARFKAFDKLKDAFRAHERTDEPPSEGSSRDAALRKRVMQIKDEETRNYLLDRVLPQMTWYGKKIAQYRTTYFRLMAATILLGALIPVFSVGANSNAVKVIIAFLGASVTAINAYIGLHNYRDLWLTYQTTRETLIHTLYCYFNQAGVFSHNNMSAEDLNVLLVNVCEDTLSKEHGGWTTILQKT